MVLGITPPHSLCILSPVDVDRYQVSLFPYGVVESLSFWCHDIALQLGSTQNSEEIMQSSVSENC